MTGIINEDNEADSLNCCVHRLGESLMYLWWLFLPYIGRCIQLFSFDCVFWRVSENQFWSIWLVRYLAARPQHRASARRHSYAGLARCINAWCRSASARQHIGTSLVLEASTCASDYFLTDAFRYSVSNMKVFPPIWIAAATNRQAWTLVSMQRRSSISWGRVDPFG